MSNHPPLSIVIPTYKRCKSVVSLVNSIIPQLENQDELLVVDDGSQDGTFEILSEIKQIQLISNSLNEGMLKTWNKCLTSAVHDWICIIHDDDKINLNTLKTIRKACALKQEPALIGHKYSGNALDDSFRCRIVEPGSWATLHPLEIPSGVTMHKEIINDLGLFDEKFKYSADIEYFSRIRRKYVSIIIENPCILSFNLHDQNYEFKTWSQPDFIVQLEEIEKLIITYSGLNEDKASEYFSNKMNDYIKYILQTAPKSKDKQLLRKVGLLTKDRDYLRKRNRLAAHFAASLNWIPSFL